MHLWFRICAVALIAGLANAGCGGQPDLAPIPLGFEDRVESARDSVGDNAEGLVRPWFAFVDARCRADGGVVIIFREQGPFSDGQFAYAMQGGGAVAWGGGIGIDDPATDDEIVRFFAAAPEVGCGAVPHESGQ
jgi:hypothetical protein